MSDQRQRIIASVFSRRNASGALEETYVAHIKIWEDSPEGRKPRYILLSQAINGSGFMHKSKLNTNGTFSVGKTWRLAELRGIQVASPTSFNISLTRTYRWSTEDPADQSAFLDTMIQLFRTVTGGNGVLRLEAFPDQQPQTRRQRIQSDAVPSDRVPSPKLSASPAPIQVRSGQSIRDIDPLPRIPSPPSQSQSQSRPASPANSTKSYTSVSRLPQNPRRPISPATIQSSPRSNPAYAYTEPARTPDKSPAKGLPSATPQTAAPSPPRARKQSRAATVLTNDGQRRDPNARISFFDPDNQETIDRLLFASTEIDSDEDNTQATLANVEDMIEGYEFASNEVIGRSGQVGAAELIEARLLDELSALEKANIHSFLESDDRIALVLKFMDDALTELDNMGSLLSSYKIHLNAVGDDIGYIQSQNRGLQVQTQNQRALLSELETLTQTVQVNRDVLLVLTQESLSESSSIQRLEEAASELYKALQAGRDTDMAATMERLQEYKTYNSQFCKRIFDFLSIMFTAQSRILLGDDKGLNKPGKQRTRPTVVNHKEFEAYLGRYSGVMLYLKEMDESIYAKLCAAYFSAASELHSTQIKALLAAYLPYVKKASEEEQELGFAAGTTPRTATTAAIRRAGTLIRSPLDGKSSAKEKTDGDMFAYEALGLVIDQIAGLVHHEDDFISDFLQANDASLTYADYMDLDSYFRRQASRSTGISPATQKLVRGAMDLIFGFLPLELKGWLDDALARDSMQLFGLIATIERYLADSDERGTRYLTTVLGKQHTRLKGALDRHINEQIQTVERTKLNAKKRKGVAPFIRHFPVYVVKVESQLVGCDDLEIRVSVDAGYDKIVQAMFESLKQMAKMEGEGEDKGQLNYHVILIENMQYFIAEVSQVEIGSMTGFLKSAETLYDENLLAYVKIVLRRPFSKIIDFFEGIERLLKNTPAEAVSKNGSYSKSALKKVAKEYNAKDVRKHIDTVIKRVEKHFSENSGKSSTEENSSSSATVLVAVWKACEDELVRITDLFNKRITQCYSDGGVSLEYTTNDIELAFKRHKLT